MASEAEQNKPCAKEEFAWILGDKIDTGSWGAVHRGMNKQNGEMISIKRVSLIKDADSEVKVKQMDQFMERLISLQSRNIQKYLAFQYNVTLTEKSQFLIMMSIVAEFVPGGSIKNIIQNGFHGFHERMVQIYIRQVLKGLKALHELGIPHLDIKPSNILVDEQGVIKLTDPGFFKMNAGKVVEGAILQGSELYCAPEVA